MKKWLETCGSVWKRSSLQIWNADTGREETAMVREYFESVLQENGGQIAEYAAKIEEQQLELESVEKKIVKIQSKKEFDVGYFSPRRSENSLREQLGELLKNREHLKAELQKFEEEKQMLEEKQENFQKMLDEVFDMEKKANV
ncbi:MAG: hypothetical protein U0N86_11955, partial [Lachnospiraceae bacterium]